MGANTMQLFWGSDAFPNNAAEVTSAYTLVTADWGNIPLRYDAVFDIRVVIDGAGQAALSALEIAWRQRLAVKDRDLIFKTDAGGISSASILVRETMSGTRVRAIRFSEAMGAEFVTRRTMQFQVTATYKVKDAANAIVAWQESIVITGNSGPDTQWRFPINAPAIREVVTFQSLVRASQSGFAIGHSARPNRPPAIWPAYLVNPEDTIGLDTPKWAGREYYDFPVRWSYSFQRGDGPLVGLPSMPPGVR